MIHPMLGKVLQGRYQIVQILSAGLFGQIYIAEDTHQPGNPKCVVKQLKVVTNEPDYLQTIRERFQRESETLKQLGDHEQIPQLITYFEEDEQFYLVQEFIQGHSLTAELPINERWGDRWSESEIIKLLKDVLNILEFIHSQGVIHCDIKPDNLIRRACDGQLFLIDFGSVQPCNFQIDQLLPIFRVPVTSLGYIPPEQFNRQPQPNSDIYALGMIAIQALTGRAPMQLTLHPDINEVMWRLPDIIVSEPLAAILGQMVRYNCQDRFQSASEVLQALQQPWLGVEASAAEIEQAEAIQIIDWVESEHWAIELQKALDVQYYNAMEADNPQLETQKNAETQNSAPAKSETADADDAWFAKLIRPSKSSQPSWLLTGMKLGIAVNTLLMVLGIYYLVNNFPANSEADTLYKATKQYQTGDFEKAITLAKSIPSSSPAYADAQAAIKDWEKEWQTAVAQYQVVETAFNQSRWSDVLDASAEVPDILYWRLKVDILADQAQGQIDAAAQELLKKAYDSAAKKDFSTALTYLQKISDKSAAGAIVKQKLAEYGQKRQIRSVYLLQQAYNKAVAKDFTTAIKFIKQIPKDTPAYDKAQVKLAEYTEKQRLQAKAGKGSEPTAASAKEIAQPFINSNSTTKLEDLQPGDSLQEVNIR